MTGNGRHIHPHTGSARLVEDVPQGIVRLGILVAQVRLVREATWVTWVSNSRANSGFGGGKELWCEPLSHRYFVTAAKLGSGHPNIQVGRGGRRPHQAVRFLCFVIDNDKIMRAF